ncbi:hypothetical protein GCM10010112_82640 [Actinoplanes lobatus]|nr:hypothetical protein GCM10010112_82640 [Actinoplanes lobatus]
MSGGVACAACSPRACRSSWSAASPPPPWASRWSCARSRRWPFCPCALPACRRSPHSVAWEGVEVPSADRRLQPRRKARQVRAELPRERILTAAAHVFTEYGYAAGTTNRIAEQARISIGSLYQYFPNKDAILAQLLIRHIDRGTWAEADRLDLSPGALRETVQALVRDAIDRHGRIRTAQIRDLLSRHPDVRVGDVGTAADLILFTIEMNTHKLMAAPSAVPVDTFATELVDMVTRYLRGDCNRRIPGSGRGTYRAGGPAGLAAGPHQRPSLVILRETQRPELRGTRS